MNKNIFVKSFLFLFPIIFVILSYFIFDPFKVLYSYNNFNETNKNIFQVIPNRSYVSTENLLKNYDKFKYDSFIFGNSRSLAFTCHEWQKYINSKHAFHYDASSETIFGIERKISFLDNKNIKIKNALLILDSSTLSKSEDSSGILFMQDPRLLKKSHYYFHKEFFKAYFSKLYFLNFFYFKITGKGFPYFGEYFISKTKSFIEPLTNDIYLFAEDEIRQNPNEYYSRLKNIFYKRNESKKYFESKVIKVEQFQLLNHIKYNLDKNKTDYKIIISPTYNQRYLNKNDLNILNNIFGKENVFNYSGINKFTKNTHNYYEINHYRPQVGKEILYEIYNKNFNLSEGLKINE